MKNLQMRTTITCQFIPMAPPTPEEQVSLDALNHHAEDCAERMQTAVQLLIAEMLDIKREQFSTPKEASADEGS